MRLNYINPSIEIRNCQNGQFMGRGVFALKDILENDDLAIVHKQRFIKYKLMDYYEIQKLCEKMGDRDEIKDKVILFALYLAYIYLDPKDFRNDFKKQKQYLNELPQEFDNLICWSKQELELLDDQKLIRHTLTEIQRIRNSFQEIKKILLQIIKEKHDKYTYRLFKKEQDLINISFKLLLKMYAAIKSRNMHYITSQDPKSSVGALVPEIQIFNHSSHNNVQVQFLGERFVAKARTNIKAGEQLFVKYSDNSFEKIFQWYGFIPDIPAQISQKCRDEHPRRYLAKVYQAMKRRKQEELGMKDE